MTDRDDLPAQVISEIIPLLEWFGANTDHGRLWKDMGPLLVAVYERWRDIIRAEPALLDDLGTMGTAPGLSSFGRVFLLKHGKLQAKSGERLAESEARGAGGAMRPCESLSTNEYTVLRALQKESPCRVLLPDLAAKTDIARKTCGKIINSLIERGLADRPTERKGAGITPTGQALLVAPPAKGPLVAP